jgi:hypothetical protein
VGFAIRGEDEAMTDRAVCVRADPNAEEDNRRVAMRALEESIISDSRIRDYTIRNEVVVVTTWLYGEWSMGWKRSRDVVV